MRNKDFRELQVSSSQLAVIFLSILILGIIIFLLGVSVGKKHVQLAQASTPNLQQEPLKTQPLSSFTEASKEEPIKSEPKDAVLAKQSPSKEGIEAKQKQALGQLPKKGIVPEKTAELAAEKSSKKVAEITIQKPPVQGNVYYIQVGAYATKDAAKSEAEKFKKQGQSTLVLDPFPKDKKPIFRVRVGGFPTKEAAEKVMTNLKPAAKGKIRYLVVKG